VTQVRLAVGGMTCGACAARVEARLNSLDGVQATVNLSTERASATVAAGFDVSRLIEEIQAAGFRADVVDDAPPAPDGRVRSLRLHVVVAAVLAMPLCDLSMGFSLRDNLRFPGWQWLMIALAAPVVTWAAWPFYEAAWRAARHRTSTMDTLVSTGIVASTVWSVISMFGSGKAVYLDVAAVVTLFVLAGRYFEAVSRERSAGALRALAAVGAKDACVVDGSGAERWRPVSELVVGDRFVVRPGEKVATDGRVVQGNSAVDSRVMTGESVPVEVSPGDAVLGGTVLLTGRVVVEATRVGGETQLARMLDLVERAQNEKASAQRLADRIANVFVPAVIAVALVTLSGWLLAGATAGRSFNAALSVLIIACPCALGLATPAALHVASGAGARRGIFFKGYRAFEASREIDTVVFDKTGTLTEGRMIMVAAEPGAGFDRRELLRLAGAVERASEHPLAAAIAAAAPVPLPEVEGFVARPGLGVSGTVDGRHVSVERATGESRWDCTTVEVRVDGLVAGVLAVADAVRPSAAGAVGLLSDQGLHCVLLTGDHERAARAVGAAVGIDDVVACALPDAKVALIRRLQSEGHSVAMVGDGINDGPALAAADLGVAIGSGTDVARGAADLIVVRDDLSAVAAGIDLARRTVSTIRTNLAWAFAYNVVAIPVAACGLLDPVIAAGAMAVSSGFVVWNSSRLRRTADRRVSPRSARTRP
jgi:cation-transporting P-type ATPase A/B/Cu+-exporting ATPase